MRTLKHVLSTCILWFLLRVSYDFYVYTTISKCIQWSLRILWFLRILWSLCILRSLCVYFNLYVYWYNLYVYWYNLYVYTTISRCILRSLGVYYDLYGIIRSNLGCSRLLRNQFDIGIVRGRILRVRCIRWDIPPSFRPIATPRIRRSERRQSRCT